MAKQNLTVRYLRESPPDSKIRVPQPVAPPPGRVNVRRLGWLVQRDRSVPESDFAESLHATAAEDVTIYCDTGLFTDHELDAGLQEFLLKCNLVITPGVWHELQPWIGNPFYNRSLHGVIQAAHVSGSQLIRFPTQLDASDALQRGMLYYVRLLAFRKEAIEIVRHALERQSGRMPTETEVEQACQRMVQDRGFTLATKGRDDANKPNRFVDEGILVRAVADAVTTGRQTVVLTRDVDLIEQFYKLIYLFDTHYRSMMIGAAIADAPDNFPSSPIRRVGLVAELFADDAQVIRLPADYASRVLPDEHTPVIASCQRMAGPATALKLTQAAFCLETQMSSLFEIKGRTYGRSTDKLEDRDVYLNIGYEMQDVFGGHVAISRVCGYSEDNLTWSYIDIDLALKRGERLSRVEASDLPTGERGTTDASAGLSLASFRTDVRLGFSAPGSWCSLSDHDFQAAIDWYDPAVKFFADGSILQSNVGPLLSQALSERGISTSRDICTSLGAVPDVLGRFGFTACTGVAGYERPLWPEPYQYASDFYFALLAHKRIVGHLIESRILNRLGRDPTGDEFDREVLEYRNGPAKLLRARSGRSNCGPSTYFGDALLIDTVITAILDGTDVVLLTCDPTIMEQFGSVCMLLETDYRAFCIAESESSELSKHPHVRDTQFNSLGFEGPIQFATTDRANSVLPPNPIQVHINCWLLSSDGQVLVQSFLAERPMHRLLAMKGTSCGKNTDKLGDQDIWFEWHLEGSALAGRIVVGESTSTTIGTGDFPLNSAPIRLSAIPTYSLMRAQNSADALPFPWQQNS